MMDLTEEKISIGANRLTFSPQIEATVQPDNQMQIHQSAGNATRPLFHQLNINAHCNNRTQWLRI